MKTLWKRLFGGCEHEWEEMHRYEKFWTSRVTPNEKVVIGYIVECRCKKCGQPRAFHL